MADLGQKPSRTYKIIVAGAPGTGKTCFIRRHLSGEFVQNYTPTKGVAVTRMEFSTSRGLIAFELHDLGADVVSLLGTNEEDELGKYFHGAHGLLAFYDHSQQKSTFQVALQLIKLYPALPAVLCGNKADIGGGAMGPHYWAQKCPHHKLSAKSNFQNEKPFLSLARTLLGDPKLVFSEKAAVSPPIVPVLILPPAAAPIAPQTTGKETSEIGPAPIAPQSAVPQANRAEIVNASPARMYLVTSEHCYGAGLRGIFDNFDSARAYAQCANVHKVNYVIISYLPNVPGSELFPGWD